MQRAEELDHGTIAIDILNDAQVAYWTRHFSITETALRNAVFIAGPLVADVKAYLARKSK